MTRALALAWVVAGGAGAAEPLVASFQLGPEEALAALAQRFPDEMDLDAGIWTGQSREVDVVVVARDSLEVGERLLQRREQSLEPWPATVEASVSNGPFVKIELFIGPADAVGLDEEGVNSVADAEVPRRAGALRRVVWREGGVEAFSNAITRKDSEGRLTVFARATGSLSLSKGMPLPELGGESGVRVEWPLRFFQ